MKKLTATALAFLFITGCSKGAAVNQQPDPSLQFEQKLSTNITAAGGLYDLSWDLPFAGGALTSKNYLYASEGIDPSIACGSPQKIVPFLTSLSMSLGNPRYIKKPVLINGQIQYTSSQGTYLLTCTPDGFRKDYFADDEKSILFSVNFSNLVTTPLSGMMANSPSDFMAAISLQKWMEANYFPANAQWEAGASYTKRMVTVSDDYISAVNCAQGDTNSDGSPAACSAYGTLEGNFPYIDNPDGKPSEFYEITDGSISTFQGVRTWTSTLPLPETSGVSYRVFFELAGGVFEGTKYVKDTAIVYPQTDGSYENYTIALNTSAVLSISDRFIAAGTNGSGAGFDSATLPSDDLFGIGGHGVNGAIAPQDLSVHYSIPGNLNGTGQVIAIVDAPASGDLYGDLNVMSRHYGLPELPICQGASLTPCFQHLDLSNGAAIDPKHDWGAEAALDLEAAHAVAPNATLVLVTASGYTSEAVLAAIQRAIQIPNVTVISMSFSGLNVDSVNFDAMVSNAPGIAFLASTGDSGNREETGYPATSPYVTAVGGTRIKSIAWKDTSSETAWSFSGGGLYQSEAMPSWQQSFLTSASSPLLSTGTRVIPDVAALADYQNSPFAIYYKQRWSMTGGTSLATPIWAGVTALIGQAVQNTKNFPLSTALISASPSGGGFNAMLYGARTAAGTQVFHDITSGSNNLFGIGDCTLCSTGPGFNGVTGLGVPDVSALITQFISQIH